MAHMEASQTLYVTRFAAMAALIGIAYIEGRRLHGDDQFRI